MQQVERHISPPPGADFLHRGLVLGPPGVGERQGIDRPLRVGEEGLDLAGDAGAPIDHRAEYVEEQSFDHRGLTRL